MASIPQINNPITGKSYTSGMSGRNTGEREELFDLIQLTDPLEVQLTDERESGSEQKTMNGGQKDFLSMSVKIAKDPTMAVESLKQIVNDELLNIAKANGYTELHGELDSLMKGLYLKADNLVSDIILQEKQNTMFTGSEFFDILREIVANVSTGQTNVYGNQFPLNQNSVPQKNVNANDTFYTMDVDVEEVKTNVGNVLKAVNYMLNKSEILNALSSNMKFLSQYFAPNKNLSENLSTLSQKWAAPDATKNFESLKNETLYILKNVSESLLNNEQTQVFIPLIVHNLSRYNTNDEMLTDYLAQLLTQIPNSGTKERLISAFEGFISSMYNINNNNNNSKNANSGTEQGYNTSAYYNNTTNANINQPSDLYFFNNRQIPDFLATRLMDKDYVSLLTYTEDDLNAPLRNYFLNKIDGKTAIKETISVLIHETGMRNMLGKELGQINNLSALVNYLNEILQILPDNNERQTIYENLVEIINNMAENEELPANAESIPLTQKDANSSSLQGNKTTENTSYKEASSENSFLDESGAETKSEVIRESVKSNNVNEERNNGRNARYAGDIPEKNDDGIREYSSKAFSTGKYDGDKKETALKGLIDFVDRNIDHSALKSINNYNASNLLQSLINAPGVFTPLAHYIIPLQIEDTKAFGELWVDKDEENAAVSGSKRKYHLFLTFDVEEVGRFEVDMYCLGEEVNISLMHPNGFGERVNPIVRKINRIIAQSGYVTKNFKAAPLSKPHNLMQIFPHINEKRSGFNVKA